MIIQASTKAIHQAYQALARLLHPDHRMRHVNPQEDNDKVTHKSAALTDFTELNNANAILSDEYRRMMYDTLHGVREYSAVEVHVQETHCVLIDCYIMAKMKPRKLAWFLLQYSFSQRRILKKKLTD